MCGCRWLIPEESGGWDGGGGRQTALSTLAQLCALSVTLKGGMEGMVGGVQLNFLGGGLGWQEVEKANK